MDLTKIENDFTPEEVDRVNEFVKNGCHGLENLVKQEHKINSMFSLYMSGKNYTEISKITKVKKNLVLYMSAKMRWYDKRMEYLNDIQNNITKKLKDTRLESLNFISNLISMHHKYYGEEIDKYMATGDKDIIDGIDMKALSQYFKSIEILEKIINPTNVNKGNGGVNVNINAADGARVEQVDDNTMEITSGNAGNILKALAEMKDKQKKEEKE